MTGADGEEDNWGPRKWPNCDLASSQGCSGSSGRLRSRSDLPRPSHSPQRVQEMAGANGRFYSAPSAHMPAGGPSGRPRVFLSDLEGY